MTRKSEKDKFFDTKHLKTDLKKRSLRSGAVILTSRGFSFVSHIGATMILARLLTPQDYGIISMVAAITGFAAIFADLGLSTATVQRANINQRQVSNLFWINVVLGVSITIIVAAISPLIARFYRTPQLLSVTVALSLNFLIAGMSVQHKAILTRQMQFFTIAKIQIFSTLLGIAVAISMAMHGFCYWALVFNNLISSTSSVVGFWFVSKWCPGLPRWNTGTRSMLRFGSDVAGFNVINFFSRNLDNILIGRYYGSASVGLYSKAYQLLMLPITNLRVPMNKVAMPSLSRLQHQPLQYRIYYMKYISVLAFASMPLVAYMFVCSENIIRLVFGPQWIGASDIFKVLAFAALIQPVGSTRGVVLLSTGQSRKYLWWGAGNAIVTILSYVLGLPWGGEGVAAAYAIANYLILYPSLYYVFKGSPLKVNDFFISIYRPLISSLAMGTICFFLRQFMGVAGDIAVLSVCAIAGLTFYLLTMIAVSGGSEELYEYYSYGRMAFARN